MPRSNDASGAFYGGFESSVAEADLESNHATKNGGPELAEVSSGIRGSYGGKDSAVPDCSYGENHSSSAGGGKIDKADE